GSDYRGYVPVNPVLQLSSVLVQLRIQATVAGKDERVLNLPKESGRSYCTVKSRREPVRWDAVAKYDVLNPYKIPFFHKSGVGHAGLPHTWIRSGIKSWNIRLLAWRCPAIKDFHVVVVEALAQKPSSGFVHDIVTARVPYKDLSIPVLIGERVGPSALPFWKGVAHISLGRTTACDRNI